MVVGGVGAGETAVRSMPQVVSDTTGGDRPTPDGSKPRLAATMPDPTTQRSSSRLPGQPLQLIQRHPDTVEPDSAEGPTTARHGYHRHAVAAGLPQGGPVCPRKVDRLPPPPTSTATQPSPPGTAARPCGSPPMVNRPSFTAMVGSVEDHWRERLAASEIDPLRAGHVNPVPDHTTGPRSCWVHRSTRPIRRGVAGKTPDRATPAPPPARDESQGRARGLVT